MVIDDEQRFVTGQNRNSGHEFFHAILALLAVCVVLLNAATVAAGVLDTEDDRPNIVFIPADDLGQTDIAPYGGEVNTPTPSALSGRLAQVD